MSAVGRAGPILDAVQGEPRRAEHLAAALLDESDLEPAERAGAMWALGRAASELDRLPEACELLARAATAATDSGLDDLAAEIRVSRSVCLLTSGDAAGARAELESAEPHLSGGPLGRLVTQRGVLELHAGRFGRAVDELDAALPHLRAAGDELGRCRLLANRGVALSFLGEVARAEADLVECQALAEGLDQHVVAAGAQHNLGFLAGRSGDVPAALAWFGRARDAYAAVGSPARVVTVLEADLCGVLLAGGLHAEAIAAAERAQTSALAGGNRLAEAEARLLHAKALLASGRAREAEASATAAAAVFREADRPPWAAGADLVALRAAAAVGEVPTARLLDRALRLVGALDDHGWDLEASSVRTFAGRLALQTGRVDTARSLLDRTERTRRSGTSAERADAWLATAALRLADGDRTGAKRALLAGMRVVGAHRATLGATELRAHAAGQAVELAEMGLRLAVEDRRGVDLLRWAERWHAGALALPPVRPPADGRLAGLLTELRGAHAALQEATLAGSDGAGARAAIAGLEAAVRSVSRTMVGPRSDPSHGIDPIELRRFLALDGDDVPSTLVEYVVVDGGLRAVVVTPDRCRAVDLGPYGGVGVDVSVVLAALRRMAHGRAGERALAAARLGLAEVGAAMERRIVAPLGLPPEGPIVIVPTGDLQLLPWSVLPGLADRSVTVTPSASSWCRPVDRPERRRTTRSLLVGGPDLDHVDQELDRLSGLYADPTVLRGRSATCSAVLDALTGVDIAHVAAHGTFRADSPLFSSLQLTDGPLTVYDLEHLDRVPRTVILPACDAAMATVQRGDELIGTAAALVSLGVRSIVAPVTVVSDESVVDLAVDLHRGLREGVAPAGALATARAAALERGSAQDIAAAHAFTAIGSWGTG